MRLQGHQRAKQSSDCRNTEIEPLHRILSFHCYTDGTSQNYAAARSASTDEDSQMKLNATVGQSISIGWALFLMTTSVAWGAETMVPVEISGGHDIGKNDYGRPVVLIAAALEVKPEVFREAFSGVTPARGRGPTGDEARKNKAALMKVLAPKGVSNERLDEVSDYYRFQPQSGKIWTNKPAKAHAIIVDGQVTRIVVTEPGSGYSSIPKIVVPGYEKQLFEATIGFSKDLKKNGAITAIKAVKE